MGYNTRRCQKVTPPSSTLDQSNGKSSTTKDTFTINSIIQNSMSIYSITINNNIGTRSYIIKILN